MSDPVSHEENPADARSSSSFSVRAGPPFTSSRNRPHGAAAGNGGEYLPADTQLLLAVPDLDGTLADWKTTDLYKIWAEPEVQAFPGPAALETAAASRSSTTPWPRSRTCRPRTCFIALTALDGRPPNQPHVHRRASTSRATRPRSSNCWPEPKDTLRKQFPGGKADLVELPGARARNL